MGVILLIISLISVSTDVVAERIDLLYDTNEISLDQTLIYKCLLIRYPELLPKEIITQTMSPGKCATPIIIEVYNNWQNIDIVTQDSLSILLARPSLPYYYDRPGGKFRIHYATSGTHAVPNYAYVQNTAQYFDIAWEQEVNSMGFYAPPSDSPAGGNARYDVYILNMQYYGYAAPEPPGPMPWNDAPSYIAVENDYYGFPGTPDGCLKVTSAHEFQHACQFAYDYQEAIWWMEICAVWMEDQVWDNIDDYYNYLPAFFDYPHRSLLSTNIHMYASCIFAHYLGQTYSQSIIEDIWQGCTNSDALSAIDNELQSCNSSLGRGFQEFTIWNYITGTRDDGDHYEEAGDYPLIAIEQTHTTYPVNNASSSHNPEGYASNYIAFERNNMQSNLMVNFSGSSSAEWGVSIVGVKFGNNYEETFIDIDLNNQGSVLIPFEDFERIIFIPAVISDEYIGSSYSYDAIIADSMLVPPQNLVGASGIYGQVPLTWDLPRQSRYSMFRIFRSEITGGSYSLIGTSTGNSFTDEQVINGKTYYYVATAVYQSGESPYDNEATATPGSSVAIDTLRYDRNIFSFAGGFNEYWAAVRFTPASSCTLKSVLCFLNGFFPYTMYIFDQGASNYPGPVIHTQTGYSNHLWNTVTLSDPIEFSDGEDFWISFYCGNAYYPAGVDDGSNPSYRSFYSIDGNEWYPMEESGIHYNYNLRAIVVNFEPTAAEEKSLSSLQTHSLSVVPNPANRMTKFTISIDRNVSVSLSIYDTQGRLIRTLVSEKLIGPGFHCYTWMGNDANNRAVADGVYFYQFKIGDDIEVGKVVIMK